MVNRGFIKSKISRFMNDISIKPSEKIDHFMADLADWRGEVLTNIRKIIHEVDPAIVEEWKWMGTPVFSHDGIVVVTMAFKDKVKLGFLYGASLPDPDKLFNAELNGNQRRAIEYHLGDKIKERPLKILLRSAIARNLAKKLTK